MKALLFSDIHGDTKALERLLATEADAYFACGDSCTWDRGYETIGPILAQRAAKMWVLPGNHESDIAIDRMCGRYGLNPFHGKVLEMGGWKIAGLGYSNPTPFNTPGEYGEERMGERLAEFAPLSPLVLVCHCPPKNTVLDRAGKGLHFGSTAIASFIEAHQPRWFFCGHIHEAEGVETTLGATRAVNVGKRGYLLELDTIEP